MTNDLLDYKVGRRDESECMRDTQSSKTDKWIIMYTVFNLNKIICQQGETALTEDHFQCIYAKCA